MTILDRLRADLLSARKAGDDLEVSTIRSLIAAIDNAGAVEDASNAAEPLIGLHHDQPRRSVDEKELVAILRRERAEVAGAAAEYRRLRVEAATELERRVEIVDRYLTGLP